MAKNLNFVPQLEPFHSWGFYPNFHSDYTINLSPRPYKIDSSPDVAVFWILQDVMLHIIWYVVTIVIIDIIIVRLFVLDIIGRDINLIYIAAISELPGEASGRLS